MLPSGCKRCGVRGRWGCGVPSRERRETGGKRPSAVTRVRLAGRRGRGHGVYLRVCERPPSAPSRERRETSRNRPEAATRVRRRGSTLPTPPSHEPRLAAPRKRHATKSQEHRLQQLCRGSKYQPGVVEFDYREADLGGTKLGPRMGVGIFGLLRIPLLLGSAFLLSSDLSSPSTCAWKARRACCR